MKHFSASSPLRATTSSSPHLNGLIELSDLVQSALTPILPQNCVEQAIQPSRKTIDFPTSSVNLDSYSHIAVFAVGKASSSMCVAALKKLSSNLSTSTTPVSSFVLSKPSHVTDAENRYLKDCGTQISYGSHPVPDDDSTSASLELMEYCQSRPKRTLFLALVSGGTSALLTAPSPPLTTSHLSSVSSLLLKAGCDIVEMNKLRRCLDSAKGGGVLDWCLGDPSEGNSLHTLVISDVISDDCSFIGSGPTFLTSYNCVEALSTLDSALSATTIPEEGEDKKLLEEVREFLIDRGDKEMGGREREGYNEPSVISSNKMMIRSLEEKVREMGGRVKVLFDGDMEGEARKVGVALIDEVEKAGGESGTFFLAGGETTVTFSGNASGKGGRNQEMALAIAIELAQRGIGECCSAVCFGTDGNDGPTDAAGAVVDGDTVRRIWEAAEVDRGEAGDAIELAKAFLDRHDAYNYFKGSPYLIQCGATGTNVADVVVIRRN